MRAGDSAGWARLRPKPLRLDPRTEISADARHIASRIVTHLWVLFLLLPFILRLWWAAFK